VIMGFDTHMILETVPVLPSTRQNAQQAINPTSRHYAEALQAEVRAAGFGHRAGVRDVDIILSVYTF
jgi:hypothetical protein